MERPRENNLREADEIVREIDTWRTRSFALIRRTRIRTWKGVAVIAFTAGVFTAIIWLVSVNIQTSSDAMFQQRSPLMKAIKKGGCVADGVLSNYGGDWDKEAEMIKRSECQYLHRALETWASPPDFEKARRIMAEIKKEKPDMIFGMFLAEAINPDAQYYYPAEKRNFDFSKMCRDGSQGFWGENTCKGYFGSSEYRKYLGYITRQAIDQGFQSFLFGQIFFQDNGTGRRSWAKGIVEDMREYAKKSGKQIVIGAQTNNIEDEKYLRLFDYIDGGVGINEEGELEDKACASKWSKVEGSCWALLWHERFKTKANDVLTHLDWSGFYEDDMSMFARMDQDKRAQTAKDLYSYFSSRDVGFLLPYFAIINEKNGGCKGPAENFYSASDDYSCKDEDSFNAILKKYSRRSSAEFISQEILLEMTAGESYRAEVVMLNKGESTWTRSEGFRLGSQNPQDNDLWGGRIDLELGEKVGPGETASFIFKVTAPDKPGEYDFQWQMVDEGIRWFGEKTLNQKIRVKPRPTSVRTDSGEIINIFPGR